MTEYDNVIEMIVKLEASFKGASPEEFAAWVNAPRLNAGEELRAFVEDGQVYLKIPRPTQPDDKAAMDERGREFEAAIKLAADLATKSPEYALIHDRAYGEALRYGLWAEVCWSANLKPDMTRDQFFHALHHGMCEWDV